MLCGELSEFSLPAGGTLEGTEVADVADLALVLVLIELQVVEVLVDRVTDHHFVVEYFFELIRRIGVKRELAYQRCDLGVAGRMLHIIWFDASDPLAVVGNFGPGFY